MELRSLIGLMLGQRYQLLQLIGTGGFSDVYLAIDTFENQRVAVKVLHEHLSRDPSLVRRFHSELLKAQKLDHPGIVAYLNQGEERGLHFLVMELLKGDTLSAYLKVHGRVSPEEAVLLVTQIGEALEAAEHQGIVHRDLKPGNLMRLPSGQVKVMDFGIARDTLSTLTGSSMAFTPRYASPEQLEGNKNLDGRSDLFALGVILFELLNGGTLFQGDTPIEILRQEERFAVRTTIEVAASTPLWLQEVMRKLLAFRREDRYQSATELLSDLRETRVIHPFQPSALTTIHHTEVRPSPRPKKRLLVLAGLVVIFILAGAIPLTMWLLKANSSPQLPIETTTLAEDQAEIQGTVTLAGKPIAGVSIQVLNEFETMGTTTTNAMGSYTLRVTSTQAQTISVVAQYTGGDLRAAPQDKWMPIAPRSIVQVDFDLLSIEQANIGDLNADQQVNEADFELLRQYLKSLGNQAVIGVPLDSDHLLFDINGDGLISQSDLAVLLLGIARPSSP